MSGYDRRTVITFDAGGETWEIDSISRADGYMCISETRKNGQEDCHCSMVVERVDDRWTICEGREELATYWDDDTADKIEAHLNKHGMPG